MAKRPCVGQLAEPLRERRSMGRAGGVLYGYQQIMPKLI